MSYVTVRRTSMTSYNTDVANYVVRGARTTSYRTRTMYPYDVVRGARTTLYIDSDVVRQARTMS